MGGAEGAEVGGDVDGDLDLTVHAEMLDRGVEVEGVPQYDSVESETGGRPTGLPCLPCSPAAVATNADSERGRSEAPLTAWSGDPDASLRSTIRPRIARRR